MYGDMSGKQQTEALQLVMLYVNVTCARPPTPRK
jgi:hypothetical protein